MEQTAMKTSATWLAVILGCGMVSAANLKIEQRFFQYATSHNGRASVRITTIRGINVFVVAEAVGDPELSIGGKWPWRWKRTPCAKTHDTVICYWTTTSWPGESIIVTVNASKPSFMAIEAVEIDQGQPYSVSLPIPKELQ